jgi:ketosteroid isomerase-like protein
MRRPAAIAANLQPPELLMRMALIITLAALCACADTPSADAVAAAPASEADGQAVLRLEQDWCEAFRTGNADGVARIEDDRYAYTGIDNEPGTKTDDLAQIRNRSIEYSRYQNRDQAVRLDGARVIVTGITSLEGVNGDRPFKMDVRFTDTFARRGGTWKATTRQVALLER